jgi:hypothetical protein
VKIEHKSKSEAVKEHSITGWKMLMIPNIIITAWFMCLVTGVPTVANDIQSAIAALEKIRIIGYSALLSFFLLASIGYGIGLTKTELSANIEGTRSEKKRNKAALIFMFILICITGIAGGIWRYQDTKKDQAKQAQIWLSANHEGYQKYMAMTENGFAGDDDLADSGMRRIETEWIEQNYNLPWYMDLPLVFIMALSINLTFGLAVRLSHEELPDGKYSDSETNTGSSGHKNNLSDGDLQSHPSPTPAYSGGVQAIPAQDLNPIKELFSALLAEIRNNRSVNVKNNLIENTDYFDLTDEQKKQILELCSNPEFVHQEGIYKGSPNKSKIADQLGIKRPNVSRFLNNYDGPNYRMHTQLN